MIKKDDKVLYEATNFAIKQENEGIAFFLKAAENTVNPLGKAMFRSFVEDEKEHVRRIKMMTAGMVEPETAQDDQDPSGPRDRLETIFKEMQGHIEAEVTPETNDLDAIRIALNIERKVYKFYETAACETSNVREKELYKFLAKEEIIHFQILKNAYTHLSNLDKRNAKEADRTYEIWMDLIKDRDPRF